ncbi:hypothetical protein SAMN04490357_7686 [Streptomyces misionensis]|uniref:Uncharacterized protein n=1 Tax=Streptomyces misionensis TaxID=67331 RepID=A0A1H5K5F2_9ACTN|nr:hypothetical protein [Streptomyces misionensis]SEE59221.1 hypothetical protein SAMN04490357_7686 [Streptomyces misionensis]
MISIPNPGAGTLAAALQLRTDASQILGIDVELVLGPPVGIEGRAARQAREDALADMVETGFLKPKQVSRRADLTVVLLEELDELEYAAGLVDIDLGAVA